MHKPSSATMAGRPIKPDNSNKISKENIDYTFEYVYCSSDNEFYGFAVEIVTICRM